MNAPQCPKCGRELSSGGNACCGNNLYVVPCGDIGYQIQVSRGVEQPGFVVKDGELKRG